jgi:hypothetical protein
MTRPHGQFATGETPVSSISSLLPQSTHTVRMCQRKGGKGIRNIKYHTLASFVHDWNFEHSGCGSARGTGAPGACSFTSPITLRRVTALPEMLLCAREGSAMIQGRLCRRGAATLFRREVQGGHEARGVVRTLGRRETDPHRARDKWNWTQEIGKTLLADF